MRCSDAGGGGVGNSDCSPAGEAAFRGGNQARYCLRNKFAGNRPFPGQSAPKNALYFRSVRQKFPKWRGWDFFARRRDIQGRRKGRPLRSPGLAPGNPMQSNLIHRRRSPRLTAPRSRPVPRLLHHEDLGWPRRRKRTRSRRTEEVNSGHLRAFIERIEQLEEEKKALSDDITDVYGEAKGNGFDVKIMRKIVLDPQTGPRPAERGGDYPGPLSRRAGNELIDGPGAFCRTAIGSGSRSACKRAHPAPAATRARIKNRSRTRAGAENIPNHRRLLCKRKIGANPYRADHSVPVCWRPLLNQTRRAGAGNLVLLHDPKSARDLGIGLDHAA